MLNIATVNLLLFMVYQLSWISLIVLTNELGIQQIFHPPSPTYIYSETCLIEPPRDYLRDFNKGRHPAICRRFKRVKSPVRLLETKIFFH